MKKTLIIVGSLAVIGTGLYLFMKRPKAVININDSDMSGTATLGNKSGSFGQNMGIELSTRNGYTLNVAGSNGFTLRRFGKNIESTDKITPYDKGSSNVTINHVNYKVV